MTEREYNSGLIDLEALMYDGAPIQHRPDDIPPVRASVDPLTTVTNELHQLVTRLEAADSAKPIPPARDSIQAVTAESVQPSGASAPPRRQTFVAVAGALAAALVAGTTARLLPQTGAMTTQAAATTAVVAPTQADAPMTATHAPTLATARVAEQPLARASSHTPHRQHSTTATQPVEPHAMAENVKPESAKAEKAAAENAATAPAPEPSAPETTAAPAPEAPAKAADATESAPAPEPAPAAAPNLEEAMQNAVTTRAKANAESATAGPSRPSLGAVTAALRAVLPTARACLGTDDPNRAREGTIIFASDGTVARIDGIRGASSEDECVRAALSKATLPAFREPTFAAHVTVRR